MTSPSFIQAQHPPLLMHVASGVAAGGIIPQNQMWTQISGLFAKFMTQAGGEVEGRW
jgi:hypothetical protein